MNVLSLFDGMSCGRISLDRAGIQIKKYYASEIDSHAIKVTQANWPETVQLGSVENWKEWDINWGSIDLLIGGSPCQGFSFAGGQLAFDDPRSRLFFVYVDILKHIRLRNPNVKFLLENVKMKQEYLDVISRVLEVNPILINSDKVSAQSRQRYFWANWCIQQPNNRKVLLKDILQKEEEVDQVMYYGQKSIDYMMRGNEKWQQAGACRMDRYLQTADKDKSFTLTANMYKGVPYNFCNFTNGTPKYRKLTPIECERLQTVPDNYTNHVSNSQRYKMLGNGWTVDVIAHIFKCMSNASKENQQEQQLALAV
jgi:site-specific DNA-cytosine methylase